jgi:hypothetical protein
LILNSMLKARGEKLADKIERWEFDFKCERW